MAKFCVYEYMAIRKENQEQFSLKKHFFPHSTVQVQHIPLGATEVTTSISVTQQDMTH